MVKSYLDFKSHFRILKGGKISLVVSALVVSFGFTTAKATTTIVDGDTNTTQIDITTSGDNNLVVQSGGTISVTGSDAVVANNANTVTGILNNGTIQADASKKAIYIEDDITGDIINYGTISAGTTGIYLQGLYMTGDITNNGEINASNGIFLNSTTIDGNITNNATINGSFYGFYTSRDNNNTITNNGTINIIDNADMATGIRVYNNNGTIENNGTIASTTTSLAAYGIVVYNGTNGSITNNGTIYVNSSGNSTYTYGIYMYDGNQNVTNTGTVTAKVNSKYDHEGYAIYIRENATVTFTNEGTLNGNIYAGTNTTFTNSGTILLPYNASDPDSLTAANIKNFTNSADGILGISVYNTSDSDVEHSRLTSSDATFQDGSTINVNVLSASDKQSLLVGTTLTDVVSASNSLTINGTLNVTDNSALLNFEYVEDGETIDLNVVQAKTILDSTMLGYGDSPERNAARVLDTIKDDIGSHPQMSSAITALNALGTDVEVAQAVESTTPQTTGAATAAAGQIGRGIAGIVTQRQNITMGGGLNSGEEMFAEKNFWFKPFGSAGSQNDKDGINGFDLKSYGFGIGVDGEYKSNQPVGFAFFYTGADVDVNNISQDAKLDVFTTLVYGNTPVIDDKTKFLYQTGYSWQKTNSQRSVFTGDIATADYTSNMFAIDLKLMRDYKVNDKLLLQPVIETTYRHFKTPSYSESGAGALNLTTNKTTSTELIAGIGTLAYYKLDQDSKLVGNINVGYDLHDKQQSVTSSFQGAPGVEFSTNGIDNGRWSYDMGFGYEKNIDELSNINISYNRTGEGSDFSNNTISAKFVYKF